MMVDSATAAGPGATSNVSPEKDASGTGDYATGGWKSEDGSFSCGYSSFRGKRASMEDYYDLKSSTIDGQTIGLFGIFDGHGGSRAAEYLKEQLFDNLMKHSKFMTDTKLAISETYKKTDTDFLDAESNSSRDDGSTASTAILISKHLYVANILLSLLWKFCVGVLRGYMTQEGSCSCNTQQSPFLRITSQTEVMSARELRMLEELSFGQELMVDEELEYLVLASDGSLGCGDKRGCCCNYESRRRSGHCSKEVNRDGLLPWQC